MGVGDSLLNGFITYKSSIKIAKIENMTANNIAFFFDWSIPLETENASHFLRFISVLINYKLYLYHFLSQRFRSEAVSNGIHLVLLKKLLVTWTEVCATSSKPYSLNDTTTSSFFAPRSI